jgi:type II secretory pathway pseudopilin PulG
MKNKRGVELMGKNLLEIILAIVAIGLLLYAALALMQIYFGNQRDNQARGQLESLDRVLKEMEIGEEQTKHLLAPTGWHVVSFDKSNNINAGYEKPGSFVAKNTLCICKDRNCKICEETELPVLSDGNLINLVIPKEITITKTQEVYNVKIIQ